MEVINNILQAREEKSNLIKQYINDYQIITLKANIVGENKNIREAYILLSYLLPDPDSLHPASDIYFSDDI